MLLDGFDYCENFKAQESFGEKISELINPCEAFKLGQVRKR